jgi:hypothetical protein
VAHRLALGSREARDVADDRLGHVVLDVGRGPLLGVAADLADHDDRLGLGVLLEGLEAVDVGGADDRVAADADAGGEAEVPQLEHHLVGQVPDFETRPILPGPAMSAGMMPALDLPGLIRPGQLGPMIRVPLPRRSCRTRRCP